MTEIPECPCESVSSDLSDVGAVCRDGGGHGAAQEGHPAKGTWVGYWGPTLTVQSRIVLVIDHDGKTMSGVYQPGPNAVPLKVARLDITPGKPAVGVGRGN